MRLNADLVTTLQRCERRLRLESQFRVQRVRPKELFDGLFREAVFAMSNGADPTKAADDACTIFLEVAAKPGLDVLSDPFTLAMDFCSILRTSLEAISREQLTPMKRAGVIKVGGHEWEIRAFRDEAGMLHRWISVARWDEDAQFREVHSWRCYGDCAASGDGMWLHVVEIGSHVRGHQQTPWCRTYKHPLIANQVKFRHVDGSPLRGNWETVYFQDSDTNEAKVWVDLMLRDQVRAYHHLQVKAPPREQVDAFGREVAMLANRVNGVPAQWPAITMERTSCDLPLCPWQPVCYAPPGPVDVEGIGGFTIL